MDDTGNVSTEEMIKAVHYYNDQHAYDYQPITFMYVKDTGIMDGEVKVWKTVLVDQNLLDYEFVVFRLIHVVVDDAECERGKQPLFFHAPAVRHARGPVNTDAIEDLLEIALDTKLENEKVLQSAADLFVVVRADVTKYNLERFVVERSSITAMPSVAMATSGGEYPALEIITSYGTVDTDVRRGDALVPLEFVYRFTQDMRRLPKLSRHEIGISYLNNFFRAKHAPPASSLVCDWREDSNVKGGGHTKRRRMNDNAPREERSFQVGEKGRGKDNGKTLYSSKTRSNKRRALMERVRNLNFHPAVAALLGDSDKQ